MQIIHTLTNEDSKPLALTIGNFDGVHIGHQAIINTLAQTAAQQDYLPAAMTFSPHAKVFFGQASNFLISSDREKADYMASHGIQRLYQIPFDDRIAQIAARDFVERLIHQLKVKYLLVGDDFRFGHKGQGDFALLSELCTQHHIGVQHTPTIRYGKQRVSSSRVREAIKAGDFALVATLLGRELSYRGTVIAGKQLGRTIDFPTANICLPMSRLLPDGVFAVKVRIADDENSYYGMCNIGTKPTVDDSNTRQIETHIFDFSGDLYGKEIAVTPIAKLRDEQKFDDIDALVVQLHRDKARALKTLFINNK